MVSACLMGENCKYNGGNNLDEKVMSLAAGNEIIKICPEVMGGLPIPRNPSEVQCDKVISSAGISVDREFRLGALRCLKLAEQERPDLIILKSRSPSCGVKQRYDGSFTGKLIDAPGVTAELLMKNGFLVIDVEDI